MRIVICINRTFPHQLTEAQYRVTTSTMSRTNRAAVGVEIPMGIPMDMGMGWYGDCDESPWACGNSAGIFERM